MARANPSVPDGRVPQDQRVSQVNRSWIEDSSPQFNTVSILFLNKLACLRETVINKALGDP